MAKEIEIKIPVTDSEYNRLLGLLKEGTEAAGKLEHIIKKDVINTAARTFTFKKPRAIIQKYTDATSVIVGKNRYSYILSDNS